ncbi:MAG: hypothetical protein ABFC39_05800, partial [Proteiniphilum sp.]
RSPQLFFGHLSGEGFVKREVSEATSSLLETETTTGQRISADKQNIGKTFTSPLETGTTTGQRISVDKKNIGKLL